MAVQKNSQQSINDFGALGGLIKSQQAEVSSHQKEDTMPNSKKTTVASDETMMSPEAILEKAKAEGFDITMAHPLVTEFVSALCPYGQGREEDGSRWVLTLASNDPDNPMPLRDFIVESFRDPTRFVMHIANNQGARNVSSVKQIHELIEQTKVVITENRNLKDEVERLKDELNLRKEMAEISENFARKSEKAVEHIQAEVASKNTATPIVSTPIVLSSPRPVKQAQTVPSETKMVTVHVEEESFWETAAKAAVIGVVTAGAVYGTMRALDYFFGDEE